METDRRGGFRLGGTGLGAIYRDTPSPILEHPRVITVQELGKGPQRCRVLRSWRENNGMVAFEVQSISTGEAPDGGREQRHQHARGQPARQPDGNDDHAHLSLERRDAAARRAVCQPATAKLHAPAAAPASTVSANAGNTSYSTWPAAG